jgi:hypothetical protein
VSASKPGKEMMGLEVAQFTNTNENFEVTVELVDGFIEINPVAFSITAITDSDSKVYNGQTWTGADFDYRIVGEEVKAENPLVNFVRQALDFVTGMMGALVVDAADKSDAHTITIGETEYTVTGLSVDVNAKDVKEGGYALDIVGTLKVTDPQDNDVTDMFNLGFEKGTLTITPAEATVTTATGLSKDEGATDPELTTTVTTLNADLREEAQATIKYVVSRENGETAGKYVVTPSGDELQGNFKVAYIPGDLTIVAVAQPAPAPAPATTTEPTTETTPAPTPAPATEEPETPAPIAATTTPATQPSAGTTPGAVASNTTNPTPATTSDAPTATPDATTTTPDATTGDNTPAITTADAPVFTPEVLAPIAQVLGARREEDFEAEEGAAVLGARRGGTDDPNDARGQILALAVAVSAMAALMAGKKKEEDEEA